MTINQYRLPVMDTVKEAWGKVNGAKGSIWAGFGIMFLVSFAIGIVSGVCKVAGITTLDLPLQLPAQIRLPVT